MKTLCVLLLSVQLLSAGQHKEKHWPRVSSRKVRYVASGIALASLTAFFASDAKRKHRLEMTSPFIYVVGR